VLTVVAQIVAALLLVLSALYGGLHIAAFIAIALVLIGIAAAAERPQ
jgi:hypothetical protein